MLIKKFLNIIKNKKLFRCKPKISSTYFRSTTSVQSSLNSEFEIYAIENINAVKSVSKTFADLSDVLNYAVTLENTGSEVLNNVILTDPLPIGTIYNNNLNVDTLFTGTDPMTGITITSINPGQTVTITWDVQIQSTLPSTNPILNTATISIAGDTDINTNKVSTQVNSSILTVVKNTDKKTVIPGESILYIIQVTNSGNVDANPALLSDILPKGTTYIQNTLFVDGVPNSSDPNNAIDLSPIIPGQTANVIFSVNVNDNPTPLPLQNTANIDYEYVVNPNDPPIEISEPSNTVSVNVADVDIVKSANKNLALIGDSITFTSVIINTGNTLIENLIFTDNVPIGTTYVDPSININGTLYNSLNPNTPIDLGAVVPSLFPLNPNAFVTVAYTVTVDTLPVGSTINNTSSVEFEYLDNVTIKTSTKDSNEINLDVVDELVSVVKSVDKQFANLGEELTYTLNITNNRTTDINNAVLTDIIPSGSVFIANSVTIDNISATGENPQLGINLGTISPSQIVVVTFKVTLANAQVIDNGATLAYTFGFPPQSDTSTSNTVSTISGNMFECEAFAYRVSATSSASNSSFTQVNLLTGEQTTINSDIGLNVNAIGYNPVDNFIYGIESNSNNLVIVDFDGSVINLGSISNLPVDNYTVGAIDSSGHLFIYSSLQSNYYVIDVDITSPSFMELLDPSAGFIPDTSPFGTPISPLNISDWTFNSTDGNLYTVQNSTGDVIRINPLSGVSNILTTTGVSSASNYGSIYSINDGFIYATNNSSGEIFRIEINGNNATGIVFTQDTPNIFNDGASCLNASLQIDFGDTPTNYKTLLEDDGPRHVIVNNLILGSQITSEDNAYASSDALGDDKVLNIQDDGTTVPLVNMALNASDYTITETVFNNTGVNANLYAWLDFNMDGIFQTQEGTSVVVPSSSSTQNVDLTFALPSGVTLSPGTTFLRVRLTTDNLVNTGSGTDEDTRSFGPASDGEVEDYLLTVEDTNIVSTKTVDKEEVGLEEVFTYTVTLNNPGTLPISDVLFVDPLPNGVSYENNLSVSTAFTGTDPMSGLTITTITPGEIVTISWDIRSLDTIPTPNPISNTATITIPGLTPITTNTVTTTVNELSIHITKTCGPDNLNIGDTIDYSFIIYNNGIIDVTNIQFFDILDENLAYVENSFIGSTQQTVTASDLINGVDIGNLNSREQTEVSFQAVLIGQICPPITCNSASVTYEYELIPGETLVGTSTSNECCNDILVTTFKQTFIDGNLSIPEGNPDIEILEDLTITAQVINSIVIDSPEGISESGQSLTGKKLLTCIQFVLTATYISPTGEEIAQDFEISACEYIVIPSDEDVTCSTPNITIEDLYYELIDPQKIFYNITYLIDTCC